jgi:hypothetical protein
MLSSKPLRDEIKRFLRYLSRLQVAGPVFSHATRFDSTVGGKFGEKMREVVKQNQRRTNLPFVRSSRPLADY